jgi:hypothetical protein
MHTLPAALTALKTLWLGSGDHRLGLSSQQLQELGDQWPGLESLRLSGFSPLQGFAGLGAFSGLTALSMKPGVGTGGLKPLCLRGGRGGGGWKQVWGGGASAAVGAF